MEKKPQRLTLNLNRETIRRLDEPKVLVLAGACDTTSVTTELQPQTYDPACKPGNHQ